MTAKRKANIPMNNPSDALRFLYSVASIDGNDSQTSADRTVPINLVKLRQAYGILCEEGGYPYTPPETKERRRAKA